MLQYLFLFGVVNYSLFELFGDYSNENVKRVQFFSKSDGWFTNVWWIDQTAKYLHSRAPVLELVPYEGGHRDGRVSTWFVSPQQVVVEWFLYCVFFLWLLKSPRKSIITKIYGHRRLVKGLVGVCVCTFLATVYYKVRAGLELGQWFNVWYMLQPCHVLIFLYCVLGASVLRNRPMGALLDVLFDLQWFTLFAIALPDVSDLLRRNFFGEHFLFYFEHGLLVVLPFVYRCLFGRSLRVCRVRTAVAWAGLYHIQVMTPLSILTGTQLNYQTHLPKFAMQLGRWYKAILLTMYFVFAQLFAKVIDPYFSNLIQHKRPKHI